MAMKWIIVVCLVLTATSAIVVFQNASSEPYMSFQSHDSLVQIGLSATLIFAWLQWMVWVIVALRRIVFPVGWCAMNILYLAYAMMAYAGDIASLGCG